MIEKASDVLSETVGQDDSKVESFTTSIGDASMIAALASKGFKNADAVAKSYLELEKMRGVPADKLIHLPSGDDPEAWATVFRKLGVPESPEGYAESIDFNDAAELRKFAHDNAIPKRLADVMFSKFAELDAARHTKRAAERQEKAIADETAIKKEWGANFEKNTRIAAKAVAAFGLGKTDLLEIEAASGYGGLMRTFFDLGQKMSEHAFVGDVASPSPSSRLGDLLAEQSSMMHDATFKAKVRSGDLAAKKRWEANFSSIAAARKKL